MSQHFSRKLIARFDINIYFFYFLIECEKSFPRRVEKLHIFFWHENKWGKNVEFIEIIFLSDCQFGKKNNDFWQLKEYWKISLEI